MNIHQLRKGARYKVCQDFTDFYNHSFTRGEILTFVETHFLPYHGGYTVVFQEKQLYLHEEEHRRILDLLDDYLCAADA